MDVLKADLAKARAASKKPSVEVEIGECRKFISRAERRIKELDTEREKERVSLVEAQERLERLVDEQSRCPETPDTLPRVTSDRAPTNGQFVAVRARCFGERVDSSQVHHLGGSVHSPSCEETSGLKANIVASRRTWSDSVDALPRSERHHELVGGSTSGFPRSIGARRFEKSSRIVQDVVRRSTPFDGVVFAPTIFCGQHGDVNFHGDHCLHQCGYLGCRVGEASNPGPVQTRQARRVEHDRVIADTAQDSVSTTRRRRRRLRPLPWSWDSDSDLDEPVQSQVRSQRSCPVTQVDASDGPCKFGSSLHSRRLPEHGFPTSNTQHSIG